MQLRRCASTSLHTFDLQSKEVASARAELAVERLAGALGGEDPCQQPLTKHEVYFCEQAVDREFTLPTSVPSTRGIFELSSQCNCAVAHPRSSQTSRF